MTRHVFRSHDEVAHVWANDRVEVGHGRSGSGNVFFDGDTIYSYGRHFAIARFFERPDGSGEGVLFTNRNYSISTSKHIGLTRRALGYDRDLIFVSDPSSLNWRDHMAEAIATARKAFASAKRRRAEHLREHDLGNASEALANARLFAGWVGIELPADADALFAEVDRQAAVAAEAARVERERREAARAVEMAEREAVWEAAKPYWRAGDVDIPSELRERARAVGMNALTPTYGLSVAMRLSTDGTEIETSWGARFPLAHGVRAFRVMKGLWSRGEDWNRNHGVGPRLGHYTVDAVTAEGVRAGCHFVARSEVERIAERVGVADIAPATIGETVAAQ